MSRRGWRPSDNGSHGIPDGILIGGIAACCLVLVLAAAVVVTVVVYLIWLWAHMGS